MNIQEYDRVKHFTYLEYCDYLQEKYGIGKADYMTKSYSKNRKVTRTGEGLLAHHKMEDRMISLSIPEVAIDYPFEWQKAENIVYCDYLEHLFLHILICEHPSASKEAFAAVGVGGVVNFIIPELNDFYSGWETNQPWRKKCHDRIKDDFDVYLQLVKRFAYNEKNAVGPNRSVIKTSFNERFGLWSKEKNKEIYKLFDEM